MATLTFEIDYDLLAEKIAARLRPEDREPEEKGIIIHGIRGLAKFLGISPSKAQDLKNRGAVPYSAVGRKVFFYAKEVEAALRSGR